MPKIGQSETSEHMYSVMTQAEDEESLLFVELSKKLDRIMGHWREIDELLGQREPVWISLLDSMRSLQQEFESFVKIAITIKREMRSVFTSSLLMRALDDCAVGINNFRRFIQNYDARDAHNILETEKFREKISEFEEKVNEYIAFNMRSR